jgi:hypothetical protein
MESRIGELKNDFNNIIHIRSTVKSIFDILEQRIEKLKNLYSDFIQHNENQLFIFGLDSFRFQSKLIDIEYEDMMRLFLAINNRMYCEYFKLYKIIIEYIFQNITDKKITEVIKVNNFPVYKDLEPYREYKFEIVLDLHENILVLLSSIINNIDNKENELLIYQNKKKIGLSIDNFITSFNYDIIMMKEKVILFLTYIEFFHQLHTKYLKRFSNKIQLMYTHINNDIRFDESLELNADKQHEILSEFTHSNIDKQLLSDLKRTINVETNSDSGSERGAGTPASSEYGNESLIMSPTGSSSHSHHNRTNSFLGFCDNNNILLAPIPANDKMAHAFGMIESSCESILKNDKEEIYNNLIRNTSQGRVGKEEGPSKAKMLLKEEAKRRLEAKRLEEAAAKEQEANRLLEEEAKRLLEEEAKRLEEEEAKRLEEEEAKRLEQEELKRLEEAVRLEEEKERIKRLEAEEELKRLEQEEKDKETERIRLEEEEMKRLEAEEELKRLEQEEKDKETERIRLEEEEMKRLEEEKEKEREERERAQQLEEEARQIAEAKRLEEEQTELQRQQEEEAKRLEEQNTQPIE